MHEKGTQWQEEGKGENGWGKVGWTDVVKKWQHEKRKSRFKKHIPGHHLPAHLKGHRRGKPTLEDIVCEVKHRGCFEKESRHKLVHHTSCLDSECSNVRFLSFFTHGGVLQRWTMVIRVRELESEGVWEQRLGSVAWQWWIKCSWWTMF